MPFPFRLLLCFDGSSLRIPYSPEKHVDGSPSSVNDENFGYVSLVKHPEKIDSIPELRGEKAMRKLIRGINAPGGGFETVRVIHDINATPNGYRRRMVLGFTFRNRQLFADYTNCVQLAGSFLAFQVNGNLVLPEAAQWDINQATYEEEGVSGWTMDLWVSGMGQTPEQATAQLNTLLSSVGRFLREVDISSS